MQVCTIVFSHTALTASGRPFSPSQTSMHTSRTPRFLISDKTPPELGSFPVAVLPGPQSQHVTLPIHGDAQGQVDRPVRDLPLPDLHINGVDENHRVYYVEGPVLPFWHAFHDPVGDRSDRLLRHLRAVHLGQVRADLPVRQPFRRQGNHHLIDTGQPPLPFRDDLRLETSIAVPRHGDLHRPGISNHSLNPVTIAELPPSRPAGLCRA